MNNKYLFKISLAKKDVCTNIKPRPIYFIAKSKEDAMLWAENHIKDGLVLSKITRLAEAYGGDFFF